MTLSNFYCLHLAFLHFSILQQQSQSQVNSAEGRCETSCLSSLALLAEIPGSKLTPTIWESAILGSPVVKGFLSSLALTDWQFCMLILKQKAVKLRTEVLGLPLLGSLQYLLTTANWFLHQEAIFNSLGPSSKIM